MKTTIRLVKASLALICTLFGLTANALQILDPVEGHNSFVKISQKETTRFYVEGGKIRSMIVADGEVVVEKDEDRGQVFVRPMVTNKPINARFVTSSGRTYSIIMQAVDVPQEDVVIRDSGLRDASTKQGTEKGNALEQQLKAMIAAMASEDPPTNVGVKEVNQEYALWEGTKFVLHSIYNKRNHVGEKYRLTNLGKERIRIAEQEFWRKGVQAVAIEHMSVDPGQTTTVFVVRGE